MERVTRIIKDERGTFVEQMLWIILFTLAVAVMIGGLATATGQKFQELTQRVNQVGTP